MGELKGTKTATDYIESEYGTSHLSVIMGLKDTVSMLYLMQEFSNYNIKKSKAPEMLEMLKDIADELESGETPHVYKIHELIKSATELKDK